MLHHKIHHVVDVNDTLTEEEIFCLSDRHWWKFLIFSFAVLFFSIGLVVVPRLLLALCSSSTATKKKTGSSVR
jgi:hypothetical protein